MSDIGFEGMWFPMTLNRLRVWATASEKWRTTTWMIPDIWMRTKQHPDDDIGAYGRYLRRDLAVVGAWLRTHWTRPALLEPLDPHDYADA